MSWVQAPNDRKLIQTRVLDAPPTTVFEAWTDAAALARWWAPPASAVTTRTLELRSGGGWHFSVRGPDGIDSPDEFEFTTVERPRRLGYRQLRHAGGQPVRCTVTVECAALPEDRTLLTVTASYESAEDLARAETDLGACDALVAQVTRLREFVQTAEARTLPR